MSDLLCIKGIVLVTNYSIQSKTFPDKLGYDLECGRTRSQLYNMYLAYPLTHAPWWHPGTRLAFHAVPHNVLDPGESCQRGVARVEYDELGLTELYYSLSSHRWYTEEGRELNLNPPKLARQAGPCHTSDFPTESYPTSWATTFFV